ncbi:MAG: beta-lactamase family protein [Candidatus Aminicenantes bacterium]|nr:beta-lactamase family protein [Candidatus Aminicenantes bacterium]
MKKTNVKIIKWAAPTTHEGPGKHVPGHLDRKICSFSKLSRSINNKINKLFPIIFLAFLLAGFLPLAAQQVDDTPALTEAQVKKIEDYIQKQKTVGKIPGMAVVIVQGEHTVYEKGFGFADIKKQAPVTPKTLFELGSNSKAFTGLAILQLEEKGALNLDDPVAKYLPWLKLKYRGREMPLTIAHFLYQTGGIPVETIGSIPEAEGDNALEKTVRILVGMELTHQPGQKFVYATINYDVLGLVIQKISGLSYEEYMKINVITPLGLNNTFLFRRQAEKAGMATGYKLCLKKPAAYDAPVYRGNTPAGYIISNSGDMARWLKIQVGAGNLSAISPGLIEKSRFTDPKLKDSNYGAGWMMMHNKGLIGHGGNNPNFSSFIGFSDEKTGVAVLANINSSFTAGVGMGIFAILRGIEPEAPVPGMNIRFDDLAYKIVLLFGLFALIALILLIRSIIKIARGKKKFSFNGKVLAGIITATLLLVLFVYLVTILPMLLGFDLPLSFAFVWLPYTFTYALLVILLTAFLYYLLFLSKVLFPPARNG